VRVAALVLALLLPGCKQGDGAPQDVLCIAGYTSLREAFAQQLLPGFQRRWRERTGRDVSFEESYLGSGAQSRAVVSGFDADVAALSLEPDVERLARAGLVDAEWKSLPHTLTRSLVVIGVRPGNPKGIRDWADLTSPQLKVLTPDPKTSGGAMWNVLAIVGSARLAQPPRDEQLLLEGVLRNVDIFDRGARESLLTFEKGIGDAVITYENEVQVARAVGRPIDVVAPPSTMLIESPVVVVDAYARRHGRLELARAFVEYLLSDEAQAQLARFGYRPVSGPPPDQTFTVSDLGGWSTVSAQLFAKGGAYDLALERAKQR
jgi:sulfate/thiosulfate-binding protein